MRFSLNDLMWSVTLASLGIASAALAFKMRGGWPSHDIAVIPRLFLTLASGPLLGMAIGKLFQRVDLGFCFGLVMQAILFILFGVWASTLD